MLLAFSVPPLKLRVCEPLPARPLSVEPPVHTAVGAPLICRPLAAPSMSSAKAPSCSALSGLALVRVMVSVDCWPAAMVAGLKLLATRSGAVTVRFALAFWLGTRPRRLAKSVLRLMTLESEV